MSSSIPLFSLPLSSLPAFAVSETSRPLRKKHWKYWIAEEGLQALSAQAKRKLRSQYLLTAHEVSLKYFLAYTNATCIGVLSRIRYFFDMLTNQNVSKKGNAPTLGIMYE